MFGTLAAGGLGYLFHFWVSKKMDVAQYGELQTLLSLFSIFGVFATAVMYLVVRPVTGFVARSNSDMIARVAGWFYRRVFWISIIVLAITCLLASVLAGYFHFSDPYGIIAILLASFFFLLSGIDKGVLLGWRAFPEISTVNIANALLKLAAGIILVYYFPVASIVFLSVLISSLASWLFALLLRYRKLRSLPNSSPGVEAGSILWRDSRTVIIKILVFSGLVTLLTGIDIILMKHFADPATAGRYSALSLMGNLVFWINSAIILVILPESLLLKQKLSVRLQIFAYVSISIVSLCMIGLYYFFAPLILSSLFTSVYSEASSALWLFAVIAMFLSFLNLEANFAFARNDFSISYIFFAIVLAIYWTISMLHDSILGVAEALAAIFVTGFLLTLTLRCIAHKPFSNNRQENTGSDLTYKTQEL